MRNPHPLLDKPPDGGTDSGVPSAAEFSKTARLAPPTEARAGTTYILRYEDRWFGLEKRVAFEAPDLVTALMMMEREPVGAWAELSEGDKVICRRGGEPGGATDYWVAD